VAWANRTLKAPMAVQHSAKISSWKTRTTIPSRWESRNPVFHKNPSPKVTVLTLTRSSRGYRKYLGLKKKSRSQAPIPEKL